MLKDVFHLDSLQSFFEKGGWLDIGENLQSVLNALINIAFGLIKYLVLALDYVIDKLFNLNLLKGVLPSLFSTANSIYLKLFEVLGILIFTFVLVLMVKDFFEKGFAKALTRLCVFLLIYFGSLAFFQDGATKIQEINTISQNVQGQLVDVTSGSLNGTARSNADKLLGDTSHLDGTSKIRNLIFDEFILQPYALLNYGKTNLTVKEFDQYLVRNKETYDDAKIKEVKKTIKDNADKNSYLTSDRMTEKIVVLINAFVMLIVIGIAVLIIGVANVLIQLLIYGLIFLFPSLLFLALIPNMHHLLKNGVMLLGTLFAGKVGLGFGFGLLFAIINLLDSFFVVTNIVTMLVGLFVKVFLGLFVWKNKGQIIRSLTKGQAELRDFQFHPKKDWHNHKQRKADQQNQANKQMEQVYKTNTAENDYLRSGIELERTYRMNELEDQLLVQAGQETVSPNVPESTENEDMADAVQNTTTQEVATEQEDTESTTLANENDMDTLYTTGASLNGELANSIHQDQLNNLDEVNHPNDSFSDPENLRIAPEEVDEFLMEQSDVQEMEQPIETSQEMMDNHLEMASQEEVPALYETKRTIQDQSIENSTTTNPLSSQDNQLDEASSDYQLNALTQAESQELADELKNLRNQRDKEDVNEIL
ncbi:CD3337/EF1877 family mobilome membrane protein [Enterococcus sp. UD-01]|jgi:hypothetical protein|uniref:CD3337/EF1877 family mobilome membrane protein n=1 Tax=Enterococcus sp. UD-01 TaxID=3373911 RepID=UPI003837F4A6